MPTPMSRLVPCPQCGTQSLYTTTNPYRPFCSERCKQLDFGAWANESFCVPAQPPETAGDDTDTP